MKCENYLELLSPYLDHELSTTEQDRLESHLNECSKCQEELEHLKWIMSSLDTLEDTPLPVDFHEKLMTKVNQAKKPKNKIFAYISSLAAVMILAVIFINQEDSAVVPSELSSNEPELASYAMPRSVVEESRDEPIKQGRAIADEASKKSQDARGIDAVSESQINQAVDPLMILEDTWTITCKDTKGLSEAIEEIAKLNNYTVQMMIQGETIQMTFTESVDREILKQVIEETEGIEDFFAEEPQNNQLKVIITQSIS